MSEANASETDLSRQGAMPPTAKERGKTAPYKMGHIAVRTSQLDKMIDWYCNVLEAKVAYRNDDMGFITYDDEHHRMAIIKFPELATPPKNSTGLEHVSFTYENMGDLLNTYMRLKSEGIEPFWTIIHGPTVSIYYKDPDQNKVELQIDVFSTPQEVNDYFAAGHYLENPMGIIFDPEEMLRKYNAGVPFEELVKRPKLPEGMTPWDMLRE